MSYLKKLKNERIEEQSEHAEKKQVKIITEILMFSIRLGLTSFGGPFAHLGYFHEKYVRRRKWMGEPSYADLNALCQFIPGPASSQIGINISVMRGGILGESYRLSDLHNPM